MVIEATQGAELGKGERAKHWEKPMAKHAGGGQQGCWPCQEKGSMMANKADPHPAPCTAWSPARVGPETGLWWRLYTWHESTGKEQGREGISRSYK